MSDDENRNINIDNGLISTDIIDEPLLIVLDEDDYEDNEDLDSLLTTTTTTTTSSNSIIVNHTEEQTIISNEISEKGDQANIQVKNIIESLSIKSNTKSKIFRRSSKSSNQAVKSNKSIQTIVIDTNFVQQTTQQRRRTKSISKRKTIPPLNKVSVDSVLSYISFDKVSNVLTVSRMGSIYYCVEDLYIKIFSPLCTFDEFINLLSKPEIIMIKQVTLSEKISITQEIPKLKKFNQTRYRLISIDSSDYLIKLKQLLVAHKNQHMEKIIDQMRSYKQTSILLHDKVPPKRVSTDDTEQQKRLKSETNESAQVRLFIQCNETISKTSNNNLITKTEIRLSPPPIENINTNNLSSIKIPLHRLYRSKSLINNKEEINKHISRSYSLPSINIEEANMLKFQSNIKKSIDLNNDNYSMPMIVNIEENVQIDNQKIESPQRSPPCYQSLNNAISPVPLFNPPPYPYVYRSSPRYLTRIRTPYNHYYQESSPSPSLYKKSKELIPNQNGTQSNSPIIMSILEKPIHHNESISEPQTSTIPCHLPCCSTDQSSISKNICQNKRMIYRQHTPPFNLSNSKSPSFMNQKQHRIRLSPYAPIKTYFAPLSNRRPSPQNFLMNQTTHKTNVNYLKPPNPVQNFSTIISPPSTRSIGLSQAVIEHNHCDIDKIPKLVVRHTKTYLNKTIDTMGQLFPTWFNEPDYRCIHCFNCDQVFTPQLFMTHVDDEQLINEQPLYMTSIQLLTSEKMSEYKVDLWNQFCTNLTIYASNLPERENPLKGGSNCRFLGAQQILKIKNQEKDCSTPIVPITSILTVYDCKDAY